MTRKTAIKTLYDHPSDMEPLLPADAGRRLSGLALALIRGAERLRGTLHPITCELMANLVRSMNSYYSNLIEGHRTKPKDMDAAIRKDFSTNPAQRALQIQHLAQRLITSSSPKGPLRLGFSADAAGHYFPNLFPAGAD